MPTVHPRYQITDTGRTRQLLDRAAEQLPELAHDRKRLLLHLAEQGQRSLVRPRTLLEGDATPYIGKWVATADGKVLHAADDSGAVTRWLLEHRVRGSVWRVPASDEEVVTGSDLVEG